MDIGRSISQRLTREPEALWLAMELGEARVSGTCEFERSAVSLARFLPPTRQAWLRFADAALPAAERDSADPLAAEYVKAKGWQMEGVLEALCAKQPGLAAAVSKLWGDAWANESPRERADEIAALGDLERGALAKGALNALGSRTQLLLQGVGKAEDLNLAWVQEDEGVGRALSEKYGPGGAEECWGRVVAILLHHHVDYGKTPHWATQGVWDALAGEGFGDDHRARELALKGFDDEIAKVEGERFKEIISRVLAPIQQRLEPLRVGVALPAPDELPRGRGPRKA